MTVELEVVDDTELESPTQYASSAQKPLLQSDEIAGFQALNSASVMPYAVSTLKQESPAGIFIRICYLLAVGMAGWGSKRLHFAMYHSLQLDGSPD
jgi:hypothetical protein